MCLWVRGWVSWLVRQTCLRRGDLVRARPGQSFLWKKGNWGPHCNARLLGGPTRRLPGAMSPFTVSIYHPVWRDNTLSHSPLSVN